MKYVSLLLLVAAAVLGKGFNDASIDNDLQPIACKEISGVEVRVNQIQIQRLGATAEVPNKLKAFIGDRDEFTRTIAISLSQKNQGSTIGPTHLELKNGLKLNPFINGNQRFMSVIANASIPDGCDFAEYWFEVPNKTAFEDIFPITIVHHTTNERQEKVEFRFEDIKP